MFAELKIILEFAVLNDIMKTDTESIMEFGWMKMGKYSGIQHKVK